MKIYQSEVQDMINELKGKIIKAIYKELTIVFTGGAIFMFIAITQDRRTSSSSVSLSISIALSAIALFYMNFIFPVRGFFRMFKRIIEEVDLQDDALQLKTIKPSLFFLKEDAQFYTFKKNEVQIYCYPEYNFLQILKKKIPEDYQMPAAVVIEATRKKQFIVLFQINNEKFKEFVRNLQ